MHSVWENNIFSTGSDHSKRLIVLLIKAVLKLCDCFSGGLGLEQKSLTFGAKLKICSFCKKKICLYSIHLSLHEDLLSKDR